MTPDEVEESEQLLRQVLNEYVENKAQELIEEYESAELPFTPLSPEEFFGGEIEEEYDIAVANEAYNEYEKSGKKSRPISELWKELDLLNEDEKRQAWEFAQGMSDIDGRTPSPEMQEMIEQEIRGEITTADIKRRLDEIYNRKGNKLV